MRDHDLKLPWLARCSILIAEDSAHMRKVLRSMLRTLGANRITEAVDGKSAIVELDRHRSPDLVILDQVMPGASGLEVLAHIRRGRAERARVPVIMITGHATPRLIAEARDGGVDEIVCKPLSLATLAERIEAAMWAPRGFVESRPRFGPHRRERRVGAAGAGEPVPDREIVAI